MSYLALFLDLCVATGCGGEGHWNVRCKARIQLANKQSKLPKASSAICVGPTQTSLSRADPPKSRPCSSAAHPQCAACACPQTPYPPTPSLRRCTQTGNCTLRRPQSHLSQPATTRSDDRADFSDRACMLRFFHNSSILSAIEKV